MGNQIEVYCSGAIYNKQTKIFLGEIFKFELLLHQKYIF